MSQNSVSSRLVPVEFDNIKIVLTKDEIAKHNKKDDAYVIVDGLVYDVSGFGEKHPGGDVIYEVAGTDVSLPFRAYHPDYVYKTMLKSRIVGRVAEESQKDILEIEKVPDNLKKQSITKISKNVVAESRKRDLDKFYFEIYDRLEKEGLFKIKPHWQLFKIFYPFVLIFIGLALGFGKLPTILSYILSPILSIIYPSALSAFTSNSISLFGYTITETMLNSVWIRGLLAAILIGVGQHQIAFLSHDSAHTSAFRNWDLDYLQSLLFANSFFGVSALWWKYTHNQHHVLTNEWDRDPDITHVPIFSVSKEQYLHPQGQKLNFLEKIVLILSPITFVPIVMFIARFSMYWQGVYMLFILQSVPTMPWQKLHLPSKWLIAERLTLSFYFLWWYLLLRQLPTWTHFFVVLIVAHVITGALHIQLTLSHYDRPNTYSGDKPNTSWFEQQILSGRNIEGNILNEWLLGGLHYQIEHHLFPRAPRHNHRAIYSYIKQICKEYDIEYVTGGFFDALASVLKTITMESRYAFTKPLESGDFNKWHKLNLSNLKSDLKSKKEN